ncbi:MAG TPA: DUF397 domain-containing protein [Streptosporangiaceae bacterium]
MEGNSALSWQKSSYSGSNGGQCIEVAASGRVLVRDSKKPDGGRLAFSAQVWREFAASIKSGTAG